MKKAILIAVVAACLVAIVVIYLRLTVPLGAPARVAAVDDRAFFPAVHDLLSSAEKSIDVILYQGRFYFHYTMIRSNAFLAELADAAARGVRVRAVLELSDWDLDNTEGNRDVWQLLRPEISQIYFDPVDRTSHSKLVIVDDKYAVVGSSNWSHYSLDENNEANVVIESKRVAGAFKHYFDGVVASSSPEFVSPVEPTDAAGLENWNERYALIKDMADSGTYDPINLEGRIYFGDWIVRATEGPLEETLAVDSLFFSKVRGESVRVLARLQTDQKSALQAMDLETGDTPAAMVRAFDAEREELRRRGSPKAHLDWVEAVRVTPVPNRVYGAELMKLIRNAKERIWVAILDARYYDRTPATARQVKKPGEPASLTNVILSELISAAARGVQVRMACDMGWRGSPPPTKLAFLERLKAAGGQVFEDPRDVTTHAKLLIVDGDYAVLGSTNWSYHALEENNETAVIVESEDLNVHYAAYIDAIISQGSPFSD
jgi:phosphatidylserine/phosphatidylglycerophosphate/cardiolipin synthase-like enzyme